MAVMKKRTLVLNSGKVIKLTGNSLSITPGLEIGEGFTANIFGQVEFMDGDKPKNAVSNPFILSTEEIQEVADYYIRLWMDLKDGVREKGVKDLSLFRKVPL